MAEPHGGTKQGTRDARLQRVLRAIVHAEDRLDSDLSLASLARVGHFSSFHFQRVFAEAAGMSPAAYVRRLRLERAARALAGGRRPIASIARDCGYTDVAPFYRAFRAQFGETPAAFRQLARLDRPRPPMPPAITIWINDPYEDGQLRYVPVPAASARGRGRSPARVVELPPLRVAFIRWRAPGETEADLFRALMAFASKRPLVDDLVSLRIRHDDGSRAGARRSGAPRLDHAVVVGPRRQGQARIGVRTIGGGSYVLATAEGGRHEVEKARAWIRRAFIPDLGSVEREGPVIEIALDDPRDGAMRAASRLTDILVPIRAVGGPLRWYWRRRRPLSGPRTKATGGIS